MKFVETEEFWNLALIFFDRADKERQGKPNSTPEYVVARLKEMLPNTFTKDNPYQVYIDGEVHCNIWWEGDDLKCGDYYSEGIFPDEPDDA